MTWNTTSSKCYVYNGIAFRLKFPKSYKTADDGKTYPLYLFFHGVGEAGTIYDNENSLYNGGDVRASAVDSGVFDGFLLNPQSAQSSGGWGLPQIRRLASLIEKYLAPQAKVDAGRVVVSGLSGGSDAAWLSANPTYPTNCPLAQRLVRRALTSDIRSIRIDATQQSDVWERGEARNDAPTKSRSGSGNICVSKTPESTCECLVRSVDSSLFSGRSFRLAVLLLLVRKSR